MCPPTKKPPAVTAGGRFPTRSSISSRSTYPPHRRPIHLFPFWLRPAAARHQPRTQLLTLLIRQQVLDRIQHHRIRPRQPIRPSIAAIHPLTTTWCHCAMQRTHHAISVPPDRQLPAVGHVDPLNTPSHFRHRPISHQRCASSSSSQHRRHCFPIRPQRTFSDHQHPAVQRCGAAPCAPPTEMPP